MNKGIVFKSTGSRYLVHKENGEFIECTIKGKFRKNKIKSTNPLAVGDIVTFELNEEEKLGVINKIEERKNYIIRKSTNLSKQYHIIASNIDFALLLVTVNYPVTTTVFIDRFLASAQAYRIPVKIIFNKIDMYDDILLKNVDELRKIYTDIGYETYAISAKTQKDLSVITSLLKNNTCVIAGHSGAGKSTLINRIQPGLNLKVAKISDIHQSGKHTTTNAEMHKLDCGGYIIDTPGIRGYGLIDINKDELHHYFTDIFSFSENCKYSNCQHINEPQCAVKDAVRDNLIAQSRYDSYLNIYFENENKYR